MRVAPAAAPKRDEGVWKHVEVLEEHVTCPKVQCTFCQHKLSGGATRIREHITQKCTSSLPSFLQVKKELLDEAERAKEKKLKKTEDLKV